MTTYEYVARGFNLDPVRYFGATYATPTAPDALDSDDGDGSYVDVSTAPPARSVTTLRFEPVGADAPGPPSSWTQVRLEFVTNTIVNTGIPNLRAVYGDDVDTDTFLTNPSPERGAATGYLHQQAILESEDPASPYRDARWPATYWILTTASDFPTGSTIRYTWLRLFIEAPGETYLRNHSRDDGLGANAPRNHGGTSQQGSIRNRGYR